MPIDYRTDEDGNVRTVLSGAVTKDEYMSHPVKLAQDPRVSNPLREIFDARNVESTQVSFDEIDSVTSFEGPMPSVLKGARIAVLVGTGFSYGLGRMFQAMSTVMGFDVLVTRSVEEAEDFIRNS
ncbi:MAG: hypothetical protein GF388_09590 [Candidatus Aegiribacteria sp.]|nr:hypothetical protein [Candidatus Aegiribacteria sp.]MBD3295295.1 hypothetical protein [Candidatus Fermentibacteria bacterium]